MNDEIKEIFDTKLYFDLEEEDYIKIKNYITNLQQDLEKANDIIAKDRQFYKSRMDEYVELKKENERLKEENKHIFSKVNDDELLISNAMNYAEAQDYKSKVEKAVEYNNQIITDTKDFYRPTEDIIYSGNTIIDIATNNINILQNGSDASVKD